MGSGIMMGAIQYLSREVFHDSPLSKVLNCFSIIKNSTYKINVAPGLYDTRGSLLRLASIYE